MGYFIKQYIQYIYSVKRYVTKVVLIFLLFVGITTICLQNTQAYFVEFKSSAMTKWIYNRDVVVGISSVEDLLLIPNQQLYLIQDKLFCDALMQRMFILNGHCNGTTVEDLPTIIKDPTAIILYRDMAVFEEMLTNTYGVPTTLRILLDPESQERIGVIYIYD